MDKYKSVFSKRSLVSQLSQFFFSSLYILSVCAVAGDELNDSSQAEVPVKLRLCWTESLPYGSPDLVDGGLATDFVRTVMVEAGFEPEMFYVPWARCKTGTKMGLYDMLFSMWNDVDLHQQDFDFVKTTDYQQTSFMVLDDSPLLSSNLDNIGNVRLALHVNGGYSSKLLNHEGFQFLYVSNDIQKIKLLTAKRADVLVADPLRINAYLKSDFSSQDIKLRALYPPIQIQKTSPAILKTHPHNTEIIKRYNAAYDRLCRTDVLQEIIFKHGFDFEVIDCP